MASTVTENRTKILVFDARAWSTNLVLLAEFEAVAAALEAQASAVQPGTN